MNPDMMTKSRMTVSALMQWGVAVSIAVPVLLFAILAFISLGAPDTLLYVDTIFAFITLIVVFTTNQVVQRKVRERLASLVDVCRDYCQGDHSVRIPINGDDDLAIVAMSLNSVFDAYDQAPNQALGQGLSDAAALQAQIEKLLQEVSAVGDGDLRIQAEVTPDTLGVLADSFNYMIEELAKVVGRVQATAVGVTNATRRILDRSAELAQASETQVKQIAQTTESVEALAVFIQTVARNAQSSVEAAQDALQNAAHGQAAVRQTIEGMMLIRENVQETAKKIKRLGERSNEIGEIVRIIEDIADQTNLLALNAAIQSAMAGEHGRGFAVVADEIRLLAERSTESTKRIATLVKSIQGDTYEAVVAMEDSTQEVVKGSQLADDAGRSLNSIYTAVERQTQMIEGIARSANDQTSVSEAVAVAMSRISEITRQTDNGTQEAAVSVSYLAELAEQLRASVSTFRLPDRVNEVALPYPHSTSVSEVEAQVGPSRFGSTNDLDSYSGFGANFAPLPELGNGSFLPVPQVRSNQYETAHANGQGMMPSPGPGVGSPSANGVGLAGSGNQQDFVEMSSFDGSNPGPQPPMHESMSNSVRENGQQQFFSTVADPRPGQMSFPQSGIGQWSMPQSNGGQPSYPQSGVGQWPSMPSSPLSQSLPQSGIGQWSMPQSNGGQPSYPQSGVGQWPQVAPSGVGLPSYPSNGQDRTSTGLLSGPSKPAVPVASRPRWPEPVREQA